MRESREFGRFGIFILYKYSVYIYTCSFIYTFRLSYASFHFSALSIQTSLASLLNDNQYTLVLIILRKKKCIESFDLSIGPGGKPCLIQQPAKFHGTYIRKSTLMHELKKKIKSISPTNTSGAHIALE